MTDLLRWAIISFGITVVFLLAKVIVVILRPNSLLGDYNRFGRVVMVAALMLFVGSSVAMIYQKLSEPLTWRTPVLGLSIVMAALGVWFTFYKPTVLHEEEKK